MVKADRHDNEGGDLVFYDERDNALHRFAERTWLYVSMVLKDKRPEPLPLGVDENGDPIVAEGYRA